MKKTKPVYLLILLYGLLSLPLLSQTTNITGYGSFGISTGEYVNNMYRIWNITLPAGKTIYLSYYVDIEETYDNIYVYSINSSGTAVLQKTLTGYSTGMLSSLYTTGKMRVVFQTDGSISGPQVGNESGFTIGVYEFRKIDFSYDTWGNRISRTIVLTNNATRTALVGETEEETVYHEAVDYTVGGEINEAEVLVYPNPTQGLLAVEIRNVPDGTNGEIVIMRENGQQFRRKAIAPGMKMDFDLRNEPAGMYLLYVRIGDTVTSWKIIKK